MIKETKLFTVPYFSVKLSKQLLRNMHFTLPHWRNRVLTTCCSKCLSMISTILRVKWGDLTVQDIQTA